MSNISNLRLLREWMHAEKVEAFFVPRTDMFHGEYVAAHNERLAWVSGFTGSAGFAIITLNNSYLFVDGRYTLQAASQSPEFIICDYTAESINKLIKEALNCDLYYDPWLMSNQELSQWQKRINMVALDANPIDVLWDNRPKAELKPAYVYKLEYAGESREQKLAKLHHHMQTHNESIWFIGDPEIVCWLLNLRGNDLPNTPLLQTMALVSPTDVTIFCDLEKISQDLKQIINCNVLSLDDLQKVLSKQQSPVCADSSSTPAALVNDGISFIWKTNPCYLMRAQKNLLQQQGMRECHVRDGLALLKFWQWLENQTDVTEVKAQEYLYQCRAEQDLFVIESFPTISAFNAHGAIVHYRSTDTTDVKLENGIYLLDSGGNYLDGTTDITRVFALGAKPTKAQKYHYTLVLKGHIALSAIKFPKGTLGSQLDVLARQYLWNEGLDYSHGSGHGVGGFLSVHEWPQRIFSKGSNIPLELGMVISNEPGYYLENQYGIRIENLQMVVSADKQGFYQFEPLTMVPYDNHLIDFSLLNEYELIWLKSYYADIWQKLSPHLDTNQQKWLQQKLRLS